MGEDRATIIIYFAAYKQTKVDIEIQEKKTARVKSEQLEKLGSREKRAQKSVGPFRHNNKPVMSREIAI